jgi:hypothetical protein
MSRAIDWQQRAAWAREWLTPDVVEEMAHDNHATPKVFVYRTDGTHVGEAHEVIRALAVMVQALEAQKSHLSAQLADGPACISLQHYTNTVETFRRWATTGQFYR